MTDELLNANEIYIQDIICSAVAENPSIDDFLIYNNISSMVEVETLETVDKILNLIKLNKIAFLN